MTRCASCSNRPGRTAEVDDSCSQPNEWAPNTLYVFPISNRFERIGTGSFDAVGEAQQRFSLRAVYSIPNSGEEPTGVREREISEIIQAKVDDYILKILTRENGQLWDNLTATVDHDYLRQFDVRGVSIVAEGYRFRSS